MDPKTLLETIGASMREQLKGARAEPYGVPIDIPEEYNLEFGKMCIQSVLGAGLRVLTPEGAWVVMKENADERNRDLT